MLGDECVHSTVSRYCGVKVVAVWQVSRPDSASRGDFRLVAATRVGKVSFVG